MKILFLSRLFYPHIGGVETHVMELSKRLSKKGHTITIITEKYDKKLKNKETVDGITIYRIDVGDNNWFKKSRIWWQLWKHRKLIKQADIVHCHDVFFWFLPFRFIYPDIPVYTTFHGHEGVFPISAKTKLTRKYSDLFSFGAINIGDFIEKWYGNHPDYVSYGGVNMVKSKGSRADGGKGTHSIIFIGRLDHDTGILTYLNALDLLKKKKIRFTFAAYGDGSLRHEVEEVGKVHGFVKDIQAGIDKADIVLSSSYLSILDALAAKKLVIATYDNPLKEDYLQMAPFAKWIVIEKDPAILAEKIAYYLSHPKAQQDLTSDAYAWVKDQTWEKVTEKYLHLWKDHSTL